MKKFLLLSIMTINFISFSMDNDEAQKNRQRLLDQGYKKEFICKHGRHIFYCHSCYRERDLKKYQEEAESECKSFLCLCCCVLSCFAILK